MTHDDLSDDEAKAAVERYLPILSDKVTGWFNVVEGIFPPGQPTIVLMFKGPHVGQSLCRTHTWQEMYSRVREYGTLVSLLDASGNLKR